MLVVKQAKTIHKFADGCVNFRTSILARHENLLEQLKTLK